MDFRSYFVLLLGKNADTLLGSEYF